jgi:hypothetical protein
VRRALLALALAALPGCYVAHGAPPVPPSGICLIDRPCWCRSEDAGARCFPELEPCEARGPGCEYRWGPALADAGP